MEKRSIKNIKDKDVIVNLKFWYAFAGSDNIRKGMYWYQEAQDFCKYLNEKYGIDLYVCAAVVSCLSPNNKWERNKVDAEAVIIAFINGISPDNIKVCTYDRNKLKAFRVLNGELIAESSPKTHAFAMNVGRLSSDHITIDKWHIRACLCGIDEGAVDCVESVTIKQYRRIEQLTSMVAQELGLKGYELQAIIWVTIKEAWNR